MNEDDFPSNARVWLNTVRAAYSAFNDQLEQAYTVNCRDAGLLKVANALTALWLAIGEANDAQGWKPSRAEMEAIILDQWSKHQRPVSVAEERAIATRFAYERRIRSSDGGPKDSPMEAAMLVAAHLEGLESTDPIETVRKSIQRLRVEVRGTNLFRLDRETMVIEMADAEHVLLAGLPGKTGRPAKGKH